MSLIAITVSDGNCGFLVVEGGLSFNVYGPFSLVLLECYSRMQAKRLVDRGVRSPRQGRY